MIHPPARLMLRVLVVVVGLQFFFFFEDNLIVAVFSGMLEQLVISDVGRRGELNLLHGNMQKMKI